MTTMTTKPTATPALPGQMILRVTRGRKVAEHPIETVNQASAWADKWHRDHLMSRAAFPRVEIVVDGIVRGYVSQNGRVWEGTSDQWKPGAVPVFDPIAERPSPFRRLTG